MNEDIVYVWVTASGNERFVVLAQANSAGEAAERILLKLARSEPDTEKLIEVEKVLRETSPMEMDFSEGVGSLRIDIAP